LTEGTSIANSPIWFSSSSSKNKHIASNITNPISINVITDIGDCETKNKITYITDSGVKTTWTGTSAHDICNQLKTTGVTLSIEQATNSNILSWEDGTTNLASSILKVLILLLAVILMLAVIGIFYLHITNNTDISASEFIKSVIVIIIIEVLIICLMEYISTIV